MGRRAGAIGTDAAGPEAGDAGAATHTASQLANFKTAGADGTFYDASVGLGSLGNLLAAFDPAAWTGGQNFASASATLILRKA